MALNRPFGVALFTHNQTAPTNFRSSMYRIPSTDGNAYYMNDTVKQVAGSDANGVPNVVKAAGTDRLRGTIVGILNPAPNMASIQGTVLDRTIVSIPATKTRDYYVMVCDDRDAWFMIQDDGITTANLVAASANLNCNLTIAAPSAAYQESATVILSSSIATTNTFSFKLRGLAQIPAIAGGGSNAYGAYAIWVARINTHEFDGSIVGV